MPHDEQQSREVAGEVFGGTQKLEATGDHQPSHNRLTEPLAGGVIYSFCVGCGMTREITEMGLEIMAEKAGIETPGLVKGKFFQTQRCIHCHNEYEGVEFRLIP